MLRTVEYVNGMIVFVYKHPSASLDFITLKYRPAADMGSVDSAIMLWLIEIT